jgi:hypothetical protein
MRRRVWLILGCLSLSVGACVGVRNQATAVHDRIPFMYHEQKVAAETAAPTPTVHRQYYDKLHKRYYYYDPVKKAYYWENGEPKN